MRNNDPIFDHRFLSSVYIYINNSDFKLVAPNFSSTHQQPSKTLDGLRSLHHSFTIPPPQLFIFEYFFINKCFQVVLRGCSGWGFTIFWEI